MAGACLARTLPQIKNIIVPTDMTPCSDTACVYACSIAKRFGAMLHIVHVIGSEPLVGSMGEPYIEEEKVDRLALHNLSDHQPAPVSAVPHEVTVHRGEVNPELIAMGAHPGTAVASHWVKSVDHEVICEAPCPVLTVCA